MTIEEIKAKQSELMIKHAKLGCEILGKEVCAEISQWRDAGIELSQNISDRSQQQLMSVINADTILKNLSSMDASILEGAVDLDKVRQNADKMKSNIESDLNNWELVLHALFALSCIDEKPVQKPDPQPKPVNESINTDKSDSPKGDFIDPELAKVILDSIDNIVDNMSKGNEMPAGWEWLDVYHINPKLQRNRYIVNNETEEVVDTVTGYQVESKVFKDGEKLLFKTVDRNVVYVRKSLIFTAKETEAKPNKPACPLVSSRMLDWNSHIDKTRYRIYADGRIEDTKTDTFLKPIDGCSIRLETINRGKGVWLIHELVWAAFHPEDLSNIRKTGNVYRINGRVDDNRLSNLIFKVNVVSSTMPTNNKMNAPTETKTDGDDTLKEAPKDTKQPIEEKKPKVEYKCIDWIPGIDISRYSIMRDGTVVDNRYSAKPLVPKMLNGKRVVKLIGKQNKTATYTIADLLNHAFPDQPQAIRSSGKFRIEDVTRPLDRNTVAGEVTKETSESERMIPVDWIDGIPSTKYLVSDQGYVFNTISGKRIIPNASGTINMSDSIDKGSRKLRIHMKMESLIWKAFHAEDRQLEKVYLEHIDGDTSNCTIKNLRKKTVDRKS